MQPQAFAASLPAWNTNKMQYLSNDTNNRSHI